VDGMELRLAALAGIPSNRGGEFEQFPYESD